MGGRTRRHLENPVHLRCNRLIGIIHLLHLRVLHLILGNRILLPPRHIPILRPLPILNNILHHRHHWRRLLRLPLLPPILIPANSTIITHNALPSRRLLIRQLLRRDLGVHQPPAHRLSDLVIVVAAGLVVRRYLVERAPAVGLEARARAGVEVVCGDRAGGGGYVEDAYYGGEDDDEEEAVAAGGHGVLR